MVEKHRVFFVDKSFLDEWQWKITVEPIKVSLASILFFSLWYLSKASDPLYAEDEMELTSSEINLPHNLDEMASSLEHDQDQYVMQQMQYHHFKFRFALVVYFKMKQNTSTKQKELLHYHHHHSVIMKLHRSYNWVGGVLTSIFSFDFVFSPD